MATAIITQTELARYTKVMQDAGYECLRLTVTHPDGRRLEIVAGPGGAEPPRNAIDEMLEWDRGAG